MMKINSDRQTGQPTFRVGYSLIVLLGATVCFSLTATAAAATTDSSFNAQALCALLPDNTKIKDPNACNAWILCQNGQPINGTCAADEFYDRNSQECVLEGSITCISSNPCAAEPGINGFFPDPFTCNYYYYCNNGVGTVGECREGYNFNPGTQDCIRNYKCVPKINPYNYCNIVPDNVFIKNASNCFDYSQCWNNQLVEGSCPKGFYFDPQSSNCVYPQDYACPQAPPPPPESVQLSCTTPGTFVSDQRTCNGYYYCDQHPNGEYELIPGECPSGRFFSATNGGECVPRTAIYCPYDRCAGFGFNGIKLANIANDNCIGYDICQNGQTIGTGQCPDGEYFNEVTQYCVTQAITYTACEAASTDTTPDTEPTDTTMPTVSET